LGVRGAGEMMRGRISGLRLALIGAAGVALAGSLAAQPPSRPSYDRPAADRPGVQELAARIRELGRTFPGEVGIAVRDVDGRAGLMASWNGSRFFPQQSVSKFWVAITA